MTSFCIKEINQLSQLFDELKRRRVFRVATFYLVAAWIVLQIGDIVLPALLVPDWVMTVLVVTLIAGFPLSILLGWFFDITDKGIVVTPTSIKEGDPKSASLGRVVDLVIIAMLSTALIVLLFFQNVMTDGEQQGETTKTISVAVLPFESFSADSEYAYFADGLSEELLNVLAHVESLRVPARTSSFAFKGATMSVQEIGKALDVEYVLEGSVRQSKQQVRVTAQLIHVPSDTHLFSKTFTRQFENIFDIQDDIANAVLNELKVELLGDSLSAYRPSLEAHALNLKGNHQIAKRSIDAIKQAMAFYQQAIDIDENYAQAYANLAKAHVLLAYYKGQTLEMAEEKAMPLLEKATGLNPRLSEAFGTYGLFYSTKGDEKNAVDFLEKAIEINPNYAEAYMWLGLIYFNQNKLKEALTLHKKATLLNPQSIVALFNLAQSYLIFGQTNTAMETFKEIINIEPEYIGAQYLLNNIYKSSGMYVQAIQQVEGLIEQGVKEPKLFYDLVESYIIVEQYEKAKHLLSQVGDNLASKDTHGNETMMYLDAKMKWHWYQGEIAAAAQVIRDALRANTSISESMSSYFLGLMAYFEEDYSGAISYLQQYLDLTEKKAHLNDKRVWMQQLLIDALERSGKPFQSLLDDNTQHLKRYETLGIMNPFIDILAAQNLMLQGDKEGAIRRLRMAYAKGWRDMGLLIQNRIFLPLKDNVIFSEVLNEGKEALAGMRQTLAGGEPQLSQAH